MKSFVSISGFKTLLRNRQKCGRVRKSQKEPEGILLHAYFKTIISLYEILFVVVRMNKWVGGATYGDHVGSESRTSWTQSLVFLGIDFGARFTLRSPGFTDRAAARWPRNRFAHFCGAYVAARRRSLHVQVASADSFVCSKSRSLVNEWMGSGGGGGLMDYRHQLLTNAAVFWWNQFVMWWTLADVAALRVDTIAILTRLRILTFVDVGTVATRFVQLESFVANAAEHAVDVLALAENAEVTEHQTLVDVCNDHQRYESKWWSINWNDDDDGWMRTDAGLLVAFVGVHESHFALTAERSWVIQTLPVIAESRVVRALIDVLANGAVAAETGIAHALKSNSPLEHFNSVASNGVEMFTLKDPSVLMHWASWSHPPLFVKHSLMSL